MVNQKELGPWETMRVMAINATAQTSFVLVVLSSGFKTHCILSGNYVHNINMQSGMMMCTSNPTIQESETGESQR